MLTTRVGQIFIQYMYLYTERLNSSLPGTGGSRSERRISSQDEIRGEAFEERSSGRTGSKIMTFELVWGEDASSHHAWCLLRVRGCDPGRGEGARQMVAKLTVE